MWEFCKNCGFPIYNWLKMAWFLCFCVCGIRFWVSFPQIKWKCSTTILDSKDSRYHLFFSALLGSWKLNKPEKCCVECSFVVCFLLFHIPMIWAMCSNLYNVLKIWNLCFFTYACPKIHWFWRLQCEGMLLIM